MTYTAIMALDANGKVAMRADFASSAEADAHVTAHAADYPDAFVVETPSQNDDENWVIDPVAQSVTYVVPAIPPERVNAERDRRILAGATFTVTGYGDVPLTGRPFDIQVYAGLRARAREAQAAAITDPVFTIRDAVNSNHTLTPSQLIELVDAATTWLQQTMAVSWAMKDGTAPFEAGIPQDYAADSYWPAGG